ncbi:non-hydrolyzing UDP-N-acetylglucosamine 2-epimerase [Aliihoeflea sp. PC F10.4]
MKILTIIGARPQFVKAAVVSKALNEFAEVNETMVHTGQHFDANMSTVFFDELNIPRPAHALGIHGGHHGAMTGRMLAEIEALILSKRPDRVLVYGDTNSTLAGALAASKHHVPIAHVEAGLRSFNMRMPEEINRIVTDRLSDILFCPTLAAVRNLEAEGASHQNSTIINVGDVMQDAALQFRTKAYRPKNFTLEVPFVLATMHRAENTDDPRLLAEIVEGLNAVHHDVAPVVLPLHPRTRAAISNAKLALDVEVIEPVGYLEMLWLLDKCGLVVTDSGGVQKEAFFFGKPCVTMREQTEWIELVERGANTLVGADSDAILKASRYALGAQISDAERLYGGGDASRRIASILANKA